MATKGAQAQGITQQNIAKAQKGQQAKADARRSRKMQARTQKPTESTEKAPIAGESALHALFSRVRKILKENHVSRNPADILAHSQELRKAIALHGIDAAIERINSALDASGVSGEQMVAFRRNALRAYL